MADPVSSIDYWQQRGYHDEPLHLVTQRGQSYGSARRCCEECGAMCWSGMHGSAKRWTDDANEWAENHFNCRAALEGKAP